MLMRALVLLMVVARAVTQLENAKLIIKHTKPVNEESVAVEAEISKAIYIESADGERYRMETNNLAGGRAMLRHVKEGGNPMMNLVDILVNSVLNLKN